MDDWSHSQVIAMLEGGNQQLDAFFERHALSTTCPTTNRGENIVEIRYKTKAALFYRDNLAIHVNNVCSMGRYMGREFSRRKMPQKGEGGDKKSRRKIAVM